MKKVVLLLATVVITTVLFSCKENPKPITSATKEENQLNRQESQDLAVLNETNLIPEKTTYKYVTAPSGLSLRAYTNLQSEKLGKMPYGTKVKIITPEEKNTMTVAGIKGAMDEIKFNHKKGFAFNGYLSNYFPPEREMSFQGYANELKSSFPEVQFTENVLGTVSKPINKQELLLPESQWHEAFITAQVLFQFPEEFSFPNPRGKEKQVVFDSKPKKGIWISQLEITRQDNVLQKIEYVYTSQTFTSKVCIEKEGSAMKISKIEEVK